MTTSESGLAPELRELYQEVILDHSKRPRNFGELPGADRHAEGYNPLCGDQATVFLKLDGQRLSDVRFVGKGCSISTAAASLMTESVKGKTRAEAEALFERFHALVTAAPGAVRPEAPAELGKLAAFSGVSEFPMRVKCATLAWHTLKAAFEGTGAPVSTE
jgi:nitrogen fixation NifU-like protein